LKAPIAQRKCTNNIRGRTVQGDHSGIKRNFFSEVRRDNTRVEEWTAIVIQAKLFSGGKSETMDTYTDTDEEEVTASMP